MIVRKTLLKGDIGNVRDQANAIAHAFALPHEYEAGRQLRALAVELAKSDALNVTFVSYEDGAQELEVSFADHSQRNDVVTISRSKSGDQCQVTWEIWLGIENDSSITQVAEVVSIMLAASVQPEPRGPGKAG